MKRFYSILALVILIIMIISIFSGIILGNVNASASSVSDMQKELEELAKEKEKLEKELGVIADKKEEELEKKSIIDQQINATQSELGVLNNIVDTLEAQLEDAESELEEAEKVLDEKLELSKNRIRSAYEQGEASYLEIIAEAKTLYEFITKVEIAKQISEKDQEIIKAVKESKETVEAKKAEIKANKESNEAAAEQLAAKKTTLAKKQQASNQLLKEINSDEAAKKRAVIAAEKAEEQLQAEIRASLAASQGNSTVVDSGDFRWPLDSKFKNITSKFGYRTHPVTGVYKLHTGVDIASSGISGSSIYAAKGGTVIKAGYNRGYGNYVVIDHGDGYATLYGHASSLCVSAGQVVSKGDVLGYVGSTGYSTGPHLHFEIMHNGEYTDPLGYFSGVMSFTYS